MESLIRLTCRTHGQQARTAVLEQKMATASNSLNSLPSRKQLQSAGETRPSLPFHPSQTLLASFLVGSSTSTLAPALLPTSRSVTSDSTLFLLARPRPRSPITGREASSLEPELNKQKLAARESQFGRLASSPDLYRPPTNGGMAAPTMRRWLILNPMGELSDLPLSRLRSKRKLFP